jgi:uncharacterized protein
MKKLMFVTSILVLGAILMSACGTVQPTVVNPNQPVPQLSVTGTGEVYVTPDIAYINIGVHTKSETVSDALTQNNGQAQAVVKALGELGVETKDIQTTAFNVYPQQEYGPSGELLRTVYAVDNTVYVTVRDLGKLGQILDAVVRSGANNINGITFDIKEKAKALSEARAKAIADAKAQADEISQAAGITLGSILNLSVNVNNVPQPVYEGKGGAMAADMSVPVSAGQLTITANAYINYLIK